VRAATRPLTAPVVLEAARAAYGLVGVVAPARVAALELGRAPDSATTRVARLLGARHLLQALAVLATGSSTAHRAGAVVDGLHGLTMLAWAALTRADRRYYGTSAVGATSLAVLEWRAASEKGAGQPV